MLPHARSHTCGHAHIHIFKLKTKKNPTLIWLHCPLYFNPHLHSPEEGLYSIVLRFSSLACEGVSWERKRWVCLGSTCSIPRLPCPVSICDPNSSGSGPSLSPRTLQGSRGDLDVETAAQCRARLSGPCRQVSVQALPGPQDAETCFLALW